MSKTLCWLNCAYIHVTKSHGLESSFSLELSLVFLGDNWMPTFIPHSQGSRIWVVFCGTFLQIGYNVAFAYCGCLQWYPWGRAKLKALSSEYFLLIYSLILKYSNLLDSFVITWTNRGLMACRSAKAGARVAKYKRLGNLSYVLGAIDAFRDHQNRNLKVRVTGITSLFHHFWCLRESSEKLLS
jgi:hypothetical protein